MNENDFLRHLARRYPSSDLVPIGIGDDGAVLETRTSSQVIVTDLLLDGVHFELSSISPRLAGRKAMAVNLSDLAAMGARPIAAFVSVAVPHHVPVGLSVADFLNELYLGFDELTSRYGFTIAGGDTNSWSGPFAVNVCLVGVPFSKQAGCFLRSTAKVGDILAVSGSLGGSLRSGRHLLFEPQLRLAEWLSRQDGIHAAMDLSDGLSTDLLRMMEASGVSAEILGDRIPVHPDVSATSPPSKRLQAALGDGEDFELLISVDSTRAEALFAKAAHDGFSLTPIGRVVSGSTSTLVEADGVRTKLVSTGWQHSLSSL
ncbi:MAG: thiamine-phosphate kinase [Planctomycetota bacterium]